MRAFAFALTVIAAAESVVEPERVGLRGIPEALPALIEWDRFEVDSPALKDDELREKLGLLDPASILDLMSMFSSKAALLKKLLEILGFFTKDSQELSPQTISEELTLDPQFLPLFNLVANVNDSLIDIGHKIVQEAGQNPAADICGSECGNLKRSLDFQKELLDVIRSKSRTSQEVGGNAISEEALRDPQCAPLLNLFLMINKDLINIGNKIFKF